jgi:N4-(beta-N-acetylglucosaminyl)-L-asparaginase
MLTKGADPLDAVIAGVNIQELDPEDQSVGYGGLPNADGVVQLDASCMHGPTRRAGAVASLEGIATPSLVAKAVMDYTDHVLLVGPGAKQTESPDREITAGLAPLEGASQCQRQLARS